VVSDARQGRGKLRHARSFLRALRTARLPVIRPIGAVLAAERDLRHTLGPMFLQFVYREPMLRYRCTRVGKRVHLEGKSPLIVGAGRIDIGDDVHIGGNNAWVVGTKVSVDAELVIGHRVHIGFANGIHVAKSVRIGEGTIIASWVEIFDNPTHPLDPDARLRNESFSLEDAHPVSIGSNVWIGTAAMILPGVQVGDGAVVGAGSIVTKDVPENCLVAGNPARVIRKLKE
jgi:acetyltransferase-like isoleucine patch superfamily enzyme